MGYSLQNSSAANSGPAVGGNSSVGAVTIGGNPNVQTGILSLASILQNPWFIAGAVVVAVVAFKYWKR